MTTPVETRCLVFVHGLLDRASSFTKASRFLKQLSAEPVFAVDRPGYGNRVGDPTLGTVDLLVHDLSKRLPDSSVVLVGHSFGGLIAAHAAMTDPRVHAVVAFEPPTPWLPEWPSTGETGFPRDDDAIGGEAAAFRLARRILGEERWEQMPPESLLQWSAEGPAVLADLHAMRTYTPPRSIPWDRVALLFGGQSDPHRRTATQRLHEMHPQTHLQELPSAVHAAHLFTPKDFSASITEAVRKLG